MKVVDLSTGVAGQWAAKLLAMSGAEVLRPAGQERPAALAAYLDAFKQIVEWQGSALLDGADVVISSFDRGTPDGLAEGIEVPASCVHIVTSTFGMTGPYAHMRGGPMAGWAASGYLAITGKPDREPIIGPENLCDYFSGYQAAIAAEAAYRRLRRTGEGAVIDVSTMEAMQIAHQTTYSLLPLGIGRRRQGRYYEVYPLVTRPCRDGHVKLSIVTDEEYDRFLVAIERPDLATDERFATRADCSVNRDAFDAEIAPFLEARDGEDIVKLLAAHGVTAAKVALAHDVRNNPQLARRGYWQPGPGPGSPIPRVKTFASVASALQTSPLSATRSPELPLSGVVVADFTVFWAGPLAARTMADLGARVIWVERPGSRARWNFEEDPASANGADLYQLEMGRNRESLVLDLTSGEGLAAARKLIAHADVLIENNRPGAMDKLGLGAEAVCKEFPHIVYVSLSGYGCSGPWSDRRSYGPAIEAASGIEGRTGYPGDEPLRLGHPLPDATGGVAGALTALRGLREREERGVGGWYDVSQLEAYVAMSGEDYVAGGSLPRIGNQSRWGAKQDVLPCKGTDNWIAVRLNDDGDERAFIEATGIAFSDRTSLCALTSGSEKRELAERLQAAGIEAFPVLNVDELPTDPHFDARKFLIDVPFGGGRVARFPGSPMRPLADTHGPAPNFGENTAALLDELSRF